jgi:hypothetical protein
MDAPKLCFRNAPAYFDTAVSYGYEIDTYCIFEFALTDIATCSFV